MSAGEATPSDPDSQQAAGSRQPPAFSRRKKWAFRAIALASPFILLPALESVLYLAGAGQDVRLVQPISGDPPVLNHRFNPIADLPYYGAGQLAGPEPRRFQLPRPEGTFRIVVVGGSTVIGFPYAPELAFPRHLELLLDRQSGETDFEVLNAGITAVNSFAVRDIARRCLAADPDLIVVHTGHNEFYGPGGVGSSALQVPPALIPSVFALRRLRTAQVAGRLFGGADETDQDLVERLPRTKTILHESTAFAEASRRYSQNLIAIAETAQDAGVPVVLTTVAGNLRNQSPIGESAPSGLSSQSFARWSGYVAAAASHIADEEWDDALVALEASEEISSPHAVVVYRKAQCFESLGRLEEADAHFRLARDLDPCRFRAPGSFRDVVREAAAQFDEPDVYFLDVAAEIDAISAPYAPGYDLFLEHVHYNLAGHRHVARILARMVYEDVLEGTWSETVVPGESEHDQALGILPFDELAALSLALETVQTPPLADAADAALHEAYLIDRIGIGFQELTPLEQAVFSDLPMRSMLNDLVGALRDEYEIRGHLEAAKELAEIGVHRQPWSTDRLIALARLQLYSGEFEQAEETVTRLLALHPDSEIGRTLSQRLD